MPPAYTEVTPSPNGEWYEGKYGILHFRADRLLKCAWTDRAALISWLYSSSGSAYPHDDGTPTAIVRRVRPKPRGATGGTGTLISHSECILEVRYDTNGPGWVNGMYMNEQIDVAEFRVPTPGAYKLHWSSGYLVNHETDKEGMTVRGALHTLEVSKLTYPPSDALTYLGMCNNAVKSCYILGYTFPSQTMLYQAPRVYAHSDYTLGTRYGIRYRHLYNPYGWNKYWNPTNQAWEYLYTPDDEIYVAYPPLW